MQYELKEGDANLRIKHFPDGAQYCATWGAIRKTGLHPRAAQGELTEKEAAERKADNLERARRRAKTAVRDLARASRLEWFVTLTLDPAKIDRYNVSEIVRRAGQWLGNAVRRYGARYILVPEHHKDWAIHFHGFMDGDLGAVDSGHKTKTGEPIFNLTRWPFGYTAAIRPYGDYAKAVGYCTKYLSKEHMADKIGGRWFYSGGDLSRPLVEYARIDPALLVEAGGYVCKPKGAPAPFVLLEAGVCHRIELPPLHLLRDVGDNVRLDDWGDLQFSDSQTGLFAPQPDAIGDWEQMALTKSKD